MEKGESPGGVWSRRVITPRGVEAACVLFAGERIAAVLPRPPAAARVLDLGEAWVGPGWVDTHTHGREGVAVEELTAAGLTKLARAYARVGVTGFFLSTTAQPREVLVDLLQRARTFPPPPGARFLGFHLEGPFLNPRRAGAHAPAHCRPADPEEARAYLEAGGGTLRSMTLAPEQDAELRVTRLLSRAGVVVTLGHSEADPALAAQARAAGARGVAHLFNAMPPFHHRAPGLAGAALLDEGLFVELIADGVHVAPEALALALRVCGLERCVLVSDSLPAAGLPPGDYTLGGRPVRVEGGKALTAEGRLAGSLSSLADGVAFLSEATGLAFEQAWAAAARTPARCYGLRDRGVVRPGARADLTVYADGAVRMTIVGGRPVWPAP